jgi:urea transport system substrate-binding protein
MSHFDRSGRSSFASRALRNPRVEVGARELTIALCVPLGGAAGICGPAALASAKLAIAELNAGTGIDGCQCGLVSVNAGDDATELKDTLAELVDDRRIDALVAMHTSAVRHDLVAAIGGRIPFVYTPPYEGGESAPGVFAIGATLADQLRPAIQWITLRNGPRRWLCVGNDYVWPHAVHQHARDYVAASGGSVVGEICLPFGAGNYDAVLEALRERRADAVLLSLIGQDAIDFNRAFGEAGLADSVLRLTCALGENELLAIGAPHTRNLYAASGYFASLDTDSNRSFKERYHSHFGERAPTLDNCGQSTYEGIHFLAALLDDAARRTRRGRSLNQLGAHPLAYRSARDAVYAGNRVSTMPIYLARAEGHAFRVLTRF